MSEYNKNYCEELIADKVVTKETIFRLLLEYLDTNHIPYAVLGPTDHYPDLKEEGDIDFVISRKDFKKISHYIHKFCSQNNLIPVQMRKHESTACIFVLSFYNKQQEKFNYIKVDFCSDYIRRGHFYLSSDELLNNRSYTYDYDKNYWQLNNTYFFIYYLIKKINKKSINSRQFMQLVKCWSNAKPTILEKLKKFFNDDDITIIIKTFDQKDLNYLSEKLEYLNTTLHVKVSKRLRDIVSDKLKIVKWAIKPSGLVVAVLGRDGSGKSTFINEMANSMRPYFSKTEKFHTFAGLLYRRGIFNRKKGTFSHSNPHNQKMRSSSTSFLKLNLFFAESLFGYWFKIFPRKARSHFILFDRCFIDVLADPVRYRIKANKVYIRVLYYLLPKPDILIILDLPSDVLFQRKQEMNYEMSEKLRHEYLNLHSFLSNSIVINNEGEIKDTINKASTFILNYMHEKISQGKTVTSAPIILLKTQS